MKYILSVFVLLFIAVQAYEFSQITVKKKDFKHLSSMIIGNETATHVDVIVSNKLDDMGVMELLVSAGLLPNTSIPSSRGVGCSRYDDSVTITQWTTGRYQEYTCLSQTHGGQASYEEQYCEGMELSAGADVSIIKELLGISLGFGKTTEKCIAHGHTCDRDGTNFSKLYSNAQKQAAKGYYSYEQNCGDQVTHHQVDWSGTVTWSNYYECHYESFGADKCEDGSGIMQ